MISAKSETRISAAAIEKQAGETSVKALRRGAATVRRKARESIKVSPEASPPGSPPHSRRGLLASAIVFAVSEATSTLIGAAIGGPAGAAIGGGIGATIGPLYDLVGESAATHEFGGERFGQQYPPRPFMGPALDRSLNEFVESFIE